MTRESNSPRCLPFPPDEGVLSFVGFSRTFGGRKLQGIHNARNLEDFPSCPCTAFPRPRMGFEQPVVVLLNLCPPPQIEFTQTLPGIQNLSFLHALVYYCFLYLFIFWHLFFYFLYLLFHFSGILSSNNGTGVQIL